MYILNFPPYRNWIKKLITIKILRNKIANNIINTNNNINTNTNINTNNYINTNDNMNILIRIATNQRLWYKYNIE